MRPVLQMLGDSFALSRTKGKGYTYEQYVPEHLLAYQISGETQIFHQDGEVVVKKGQVCLGQRNQLAKCIKVPPPGGEYQAFSVVLSTERLRQFAQENEITCNERFKGAKNMILKPNPLLTGFFHSVLPYMEDWERVGKNLGPMKVREAIELVLRLEPELKPALFDFSAPYKTDLEGFMLKNFHFNTPIENFAKLSGRSLATFKRDFAATFNMSPASWLKDRRLTEALYLIKQKNQKPAEIYLDLGFENLSHFYTSFKRKYGKTPAQVN